MNKKVFNTIVVITLAVVVFLGWSKFNTKGQPDGAAPDFLPETVLSLPRTTFLTGEGAIQQISRMHGKDIAIQEGYVAKYQGEGQEVTLWISVSPTEAEGEALFRVMDEKMPASKVFTDREEMAIKGTKVVKVRGMGQEHYYWVNGKYNYWAAVAGMDGKEVVEELVK